jgi:nucleotide-binding universal stress UspA family protein
MSEEKGREVFSKILWATDGSEAADNALAYVERFAALTGGVVEVVHVADNPIGSMADVADIEEAGSEAQSKINEQVAALSAKGLDTHLTLVPGRQRTAAHTIAEIAEKVDASMIVVGTRGHTTGGRNVLGSVTQTLLHVSPCPVVSVPDHITPRSRGA